MSTYLQDVQSGLPSSEISSVYCSQAAVLMCRECLRNTAGLGGLVTKLMSMNSRLTSPSMLYDIFHLHSRKIPNSELDCTLRCS